MRILGCERHHEQGCPCSPQVWFDAPPPDKCPLCGADDVLHYSDRCVQNQIDQLKAQVAALLTHTGKAT